MASQKMGLSWDGLDELRQVLGRMPAVLQPEVQARAFAHAGAAATTLRAAYPEGPTGNLRRGVRLDQRAARGGGSATVLVSAAPHAWIYERGTKPREGRGGSATGKGSRSHGALANRGFMPRSDAFARVVGPARRRLIDDLTALLVQRGFVVRDAA
jgi:hypothetical protein